MDKTLWALVNNEPEALLRVTGLIRRKGCVMKKLNMEEASDKAFANLTITIGDIGEIGHIISSMEKFMDVHSVKEVFDTVNYKAAAN